MCLDKTPRVTLVARSRTNQPPTQGPKRILIGKSIGVVLFGTLVLVLAPRRYDVAKAVVPALAVAERIMKTSGRSGPCRAMATYATRANQYSKDSPVLVDLHENELAWREFS